MTFIFDFENSDGAPDYRLVSCDNYQIALTLFESGIPDYKKILHVYVRLF